MNADFVDADHPPPELAALLEDIATGALRWVWEHRHRFELPEDVTAPETDLNWTMKPLGELAQLSAVIGQHTHFGEPIRKLADELLEFAWREMYAGNLLLDFFHAEPHATYPLEIYAAFAGAGLRNAEFEEFAALRVRTLSWRHTEQDPNRRLGILAAERRIGLRPHGETGPALRRTWLGGRPEPWAFDRAAGYALTHTVFHLTDWGSAPTLVPADVADYLHAWLPSWLDTCLEDQQWDLSCELLAVGASLPRPYPATDQDWAWQRLDQARTPEGALREVATSTPDPDEAMFFARHYHSTLASAFAAALSRSRLGVGARSRVRDVPADAARTADTAHAVDAGEPGAQQAGVRP